MAAISSTGTRRDKLDVQQQTTVVCLQRLQLQQLQLIKHSLACRVWKLRPDCLLVGQLLINGQYN